MYKSCDVKKPLVEGSVPMEWKRTNFVPKFRRDDRNTALNTQAGMLSWKKDNQGKIDVCCEAETP